MQRRVFWICRLTRTHGGPARGLRCCQRKEQPASFPPPESLLLSPPPTDAGGRELHPTGEAGEASAGGILPRVLDGGQSTSLVFSPVRRLPRAQRARGLTLRGEVQPQTHWTPAGWSRRRGSCWPRRPPRRAPLSLRAPRSPAADAPPPPLRLLARGQARVAATRCHSAVSEGLLNKSVNKSQAEK